jgi:hypothetical protein
VGRDDAREARRSHDVRVRRRPSTWRRGRAVAPAPCCCARRGSVCCDHALGIRARRRTLRIGGREALLDKYVVISSWYLLRSGAGTSTLSAGAPRGAWPLKFRCGRRALEGVVVAGVAGQLDADRPNERAVFAQKFDVRHGEALEPQAISVRRWRATSRRRSRQRAVTRPTNYGPLSTVYERGTP